MSRVTALMVSVALALATVAIAGCGGSSNSSSTTSATPKAGGTLSVSQGEEVITLDPLKALDTSSINVLSQINETLFKVNAQDENEPWLAESAKESDGGRVWTLQLRKGAEFSNGKPMTSADVLFTLEAAKKSALWTAVLEGIKSIAAPSPSTIVITNFKPAPELPALLSQYSFGIVPRDFGGVTEKEFAQHPIGTGPFMLSSWRHGESITLVKNPHYWEKGKPYLDKLTFQAVPSPESRVAQLKGGQLDLIYQPPWSQVEAIASTPGLTVPHLPLGFVESIVLNSRIPLFRNMKAREAFNLAIDREGIVSAVLVGRGEPAGGWLPAVVPFSDQSIKAPSRDVEKAKQLLAEAVKAGVNPSFVLSTYAEDSFWSDAAQIVQQNLEEVGFHVQLRPSDISSVLENMAAGKFDAVTDYGYWATPSPVENVAFYNVSEGIYTGAPTDKTTELTEAAMSEPNEQKRADYWHQIQQIVAAEKRFLPVAYMPYLWALHSDISGFVVNATGLPWFADAGFSE